MTQKGMGEASKYAGDTAKPRKAGKSKEAEIELGTLPIYLCALWTALCTHKNIHFTMNLQKS